MNQDKGGNKDNNPEKKRHRRKKVEIEKLLFNAATKIIEKHGFPGLSVTRIAHVARIEPPVFYNRYKDIEDFIEKYVRNYDYWLRDTIGVSATSGNPVEDMIAILDELIDSLVENIPMQKLIAWEMNEENHITKRTAQARGLTSGYIISYFTETLKNCTVKYDYSISLIIGGLYYLIIHRNLGTFNYIDFSKKESIDRLKENLHLILYKLFDDYNSSPDNTLHTQKHGMEDAARELIKNNVDYKVIKKATKLSDAKLKSLYP